MTQSRTRTWLSIVAMLACCCLTVVAVQAQQQDAKKAHEFRGKVQKVDATANALTVDGENVEGWMGAMSMTYRVDTPEVLGQVRAGDTITATVYDGDFTTLHGVKVAAGTASASRYELPPISYVCPSIGEETYVDDHPGACPKSGARLQPVRLMTAYSCLKFQGYVREAPGRCPVDRSDLVPVTVGLYFTCQSDRSVHDLNPGACADGTARIRAYERQPHGDHNPRHGGLLFMSQDQWHHLEGTLVAPNVFRLYLYDDMTRPLAVTGMSARVAKANGNAEETGPPVSLSPEHNKDGNTMAASIGELAFPVNLKLHVAFKQGTPEQAFDFTFPAFSKEP